MNTQSFSITEAFRFSFRIFARNFLLLFGLLLVGVTIEFGADVINKRLVTIPCQILEDINNPSAVDLQPEEEESELSPVVMTEKERLHARDRKSEEINEKYIKVKDCFKENFFPFLLGLVIRILAAIFSFVLQMGWARIGLDLYDTGISSFNRIFVTLPLFFTYLISCILYISMSSIGLLLLIIPGIIWSIKYSFFSLIIIDTGCGAIEALRRSGHLTYGYKWRLSLFFVPLLIILEVINYITIIGLTLLAPVLIYLPYVYIYRTLQNAKKSDIKEII